MKKVFSTIMALYALCSVSVAQKMQFDSLKQFNLEEVVVAATRAGSSTPVTFVDVSSEEIKQRNAAQNIPSILQTLTSIVSFTEDGSGLGNTSFRIRGTDATRINVTLNGMPLNNPESQEVYWVNLPDISNSLQSIQVQRGIGTSTNGSAAFGASISMKTVGARTQAYGEASTTIGSYRTFSSTLSGGTGILKNGLSFDARYSRNTGKGYIRNGKVDHSNFYSSLSHYTDDQLIRLVYINGNQHTGITWEGVSEDQMKDSEYGRRYNPAGEYFDEAGNRLYYDNETDNYFSNIAQLIYSRQLNEAISLNAGLNYNHGFGYYENYREDKEYSDFGLINQTINGVAHEYSDIIKQELMVNDFYFGNVSINYNKDKLHLDTGALYSFYDGDHYGKLPWIKWNQNINTKEYEWYRNNGKKKEFNVFAKGEYQLTKIISLFGDLQYRYINYFLKGIDKDFVEMNGNYNYNFLNPKAGLFAQLDNENQIYASVAVGQREPLRADLKDGAKGTDPTPILPERMIDYELGYRFNGDNGIHLGANLYFMDYNNQMVQTGKQNDVGYKLMENVKDSYRGGIEIEASIPIVEKFRFDANATFSQNKIKNYIAYFDQYTNSSDYEWVGQISKKYDKTNISYSPNIVSAIGLTYQPTSAWIFNILGKYVDKQYLDNTSNDLKSIDPYFVSNFTVGYTFRNTPIGQISVQGYINNLFNSEYVANGWAATDTFEDGSTINYVGYYPQATRNFLMRMTINF